MNFETVTVEFFCSRFFHHLSYDVSLPFITSSKFVFFFPVGAGGGGGGINEGQSSAKSATVQKLFFYLSDIMML